MVKPLIVAMGLFLAASVASAQEKDPGFWTYWGDGNAELTGYQLTYPRYGQLRHGTAVSIFVTEDFSTSRRVKVEKGQVPDTDILPVLKQNLVKDFQTGIYDYNLMTQSFAATQAVDSRPAGALVKSVFSAQEWCGNVYHETIYGASQMERQYRSYFSGETKPPYRSEYPADAVIEEQVPTLVRELFGRRLAAGESMTVPYLPSAERARLSHKEMAWTTAKITHVKGRKRVKTPAGLYISEQWTIEPKGWPTMNYFLDYQYPRTIVKWEGEDGEVALMTGTARLPYWKMHDEGDEKMLEKIGLGKSE
ncbi:MAG: hypothetical protein H6685_01055 [Deltaproteobacteria bacterium]|nr:hypothetical protein [Deltaproteobacteria bacterium]